MQIKITGQPVGKPFENKKKTGFIQKIAVMNGAAIDAITSVFSSNLVDFNADDKGLISVTCELPDFMLASR